MIPVIGQSLTFKTKSQLKELFTNSNSSPTYYGIRKAHLYNYAGKSFEIIRITQKDILDREYGRYSVDLEESGTNSCPNSWYTYPEAVFSKNNLMLKLKLIGKK